MFHLVLGVMLSFLQQSSVLVKLHQPMTIHCFKRVAMKSKDDADHGEEAESINSVQDSLECGERSSEDGLQSETSVFPATDSPSSSAAAANDGQPKRSSKPKGKSTPTITKSSTKRPWATKGSKGQ